MTPEDFVENALISLVKAGASGEVKFDLWVMPVQYLNEENKEIFWDIEVVDQSPTASNIKFSVFIGKEK